MNFVNGLIIGLLRAFMLAVITLVYIPLIVIGTLVALLADFFAVWCQANIKLVDVLGDTAEFVKRIQPLPRQ